MSRSNGKFNWNESITLKELMDVKLKTLEKEIVLARDQLDVRLEHMNEFRAQLRDQGNTFMTRTDYDAKHLVLETKIDML